MSNFEPNIQISTLPNGLRVVTAALPSQNVTVTVFNNVGNRNETEIETGISHFLEHMAFKGTKTRDAKQITEEVELLGSDVNAFTSNNITAYLVRGIASTVPTTLDILSDVMINSTLPENEIELEKGAVIEEINESNDSVHDIAYDHLMLTAYPGQPYGRPILGSEEHVKSFTREMIADYMTRHYHANEMIVVGAGGVDHREFVTEVAKRFGAIEGRQTVPPTPITFGGGVSVVNDDRFEQAHILIGMPVAGDRSEEFSTFAVLSNLLGGGMSSPLFQEVREKRGLVYSVGSTVYRQPEESMFMIYASMSPKNIATYLPVALDELKKIAEGDIKDNDIIRAKNTLLRKSAQASESQSALSQKIAMDLFNGGKIRSFASVTAEIVAVTKNDLIAAAKAMLETYPAVSVAGNSPQDVDYYEGVIAEYFTGAKA